MVLRNLTLAAKNPAPLYVAAMTIPSLVDFLASLADPSSELLAELNTLIRQEFYHNHQVFQGAGQVENRLWYLPQGLVRAYYFDVSGKEHTLHFFLGGEVIFSWQGVFQEPADYYLEALEPTHLVAINYTTVESLRTRFPEFKVMANTIVRRRLLQDHFYSRLMTWSAEERYRQFRKVNPVIFQRVSVRLIATYLNMTRENLSKLISHDHR